MKKIGDALPHALELERGCEEQTYWIRMLACLQAIIDLVVPKGEPAPVRLRT